MKTVIKFKLCNVGTAEVHNRRDRAYCEAVARKFGHTYFVTPIEVNGNSMQRTILMQCELPCIIVILMERNLL